MKRKKVIICTLITSILFCISVIVFSSYFQDNDYKTLFKKVNNKSNDYTNTDTDIDLSKYMYDYKEDELGISEKELDYITTASDSISFSDDNDLVILNKSDAISDVDILFNLFKYSYAGYSYFGGDDIFKNAKESIIESINRFPEEKIDSNKVEKIIALNTEFIQDGYFSINYKSPLKKHSYYSNEYIPAMKSKKGYYINENGQKWYVKAINDSYDFENYLKLSINQEGELCYYFGVLDDSNNSHKIKITLQSKNEKIEKI